MGKTFEEIMRKATRPIPAPGIKPTLLDNNKLPNTVLPTIPSSLLTSVPASSLTGTLPAGTFPTYSNHTLTITATGSPTVGNGTATCRYSQHGKLVHFYGTLTFGSTTSFGTSTPSFSLPVSAASTVFASGMSAGLVFMFDLSTGNSGFGYVAPTAALTWQVGYPATYLGLIASVAATTPWTWTTGDFLSWNFVYEAT